MITFQTNTSSGLYKKLQENDATYNAITVLNDGTIQFDETQHDAVPAYQFIKSILDGTNTKRGKNAYSDLALVARDLDNSNKKPTTEFENSYRQITSATEILNLIGSSVAHNPSQAICTNLNDYKTTYAPDSSDPDWNFYDTKWQNYCTPTPPPPGGETGGVTPEHGFDVWSVVGGGVASLVVGGLSFAFPATKSITLAFSLLEGLAGGGITAGLSDTNESVLGSSVLGAVSAFVSSNVGLLFRGAGPLGLGINIGITAVLMGATGLSAYVMNKFDPNSQQTPNENATENTWSKIKESLKGAFSREALVSAVLSGLVGHGFGAYRRRPITPNEQPTNLHRVANTGAPVPATSTPRVVEAPRPTPPTAPDIDQILQPGRDLLAIEATPATMNLGQSRDHVEAIGRERASLEYHADPQNEANRTDPTRRDRVVGLQQDLGAKQATVQEWRATDYRQINTLAEGDTLSQSVRAIRTPEEAAQLLREGGLARVWNNLESLPNQNKPSGNLTIEGSNASPADVQSRLSTRIISGGIAAREHVTVLQRVINNPETITPADVAQVRALFDLKEGLLAGRRDAVVGNSDHLLYPLVDPADVSMGTLIDHAYASTLARTPKSSGQTGTFPLDGSLFNHLEADPDRGGFRHVSPNDSATPARRATDVPELTEAEQAALAAHLAETEPTSASTAPDAAGPTAQVEADSAAPASVSSPITKLQLSLSGKREGAPAALETAVAHVEALVDGGTSPRDVADYIAILRRSSALLADNTNADVLAPRIEALDARLTQARQRAIAGSRENPAEVEGDIRALITRARRPVANDADGSLVEREVHFLRQVRARLEAKPFEGSDDLVAQINDLTPSPTRAASEAPPGTLGKARIGGKPGPDSARLGGQEPSPTSNGYNSRQIEVNKGSHAETIQHLVNEQRENLAQAQARLESARESHEQATSEAKRLAREVQDLEAQTPELNSQLNQAKGQLGLSIEAFDTIQAKVGPLRSKIRNEQNNVNTFKADIQTATEARNKAKANLAQAKDEHAQAKSELNSATSEANNGKIQHTEVTPFSEKLNTAKDKLKQAKSALAEANASVEENRAQLKQSQEKLARYTAELEALTPAFEKAKTENRAALDQRDGALLAYNSHVAQVESARATLQAARTNNRIATRELATAQSNVTNAQDRYNNAIEIRDNARAQLAGEIPGLEAQVAAARPKSLLARQIAQTANKRLSYQEGEYTRLNNEALPLEAQAEQATATATKLRRASNEAEAALAEARSNVEGKKGLHLWNANRRLETAEENALRLEAESHQAEQLAQTQREQAEAARRAANDAQEKALAARANADAANQAKNKAEARLAALQAELDAIRNS